MNVVFSCTEENCCIVLENMLGILDTLHLSAEHSIIASDVKLYLTVFLWCLNRALIFNLFGSFQISVTVDWETIMKIPTGDSSPLSGVKATAAGIK